MTKDYKQRLVEKWNNSSTIRDHNASFIVRVDAITGEIDIDKDKRGEAFYNISLAKLLMRLSSHLRNEDEKNLLREFADRLENLKSFM